MNDTIQTLLRYLLKAGSAALITHGWMTANQVNQAAVIFLGLPPWAQMTLGFLVAAGSVYWGVVHRTPAAASTAPQVVPIRITNALASLLLLFALGTACQARITIQTPQNSPVLSAGNAPNQAVGTLYATNVDTSNLVVRGTATFNQAGTNVTVSTLTASSIAAGTASLGSATLGSTTITNLTVVNGLGSATITNLTVINLATTNQIQVNLLVTNFGGPSGSNFRDIPDPLPQYIVVTNCDGKGVFLPTPNGRKLKLTFRARNMSSFYVGVNTTAGTQLDPGIGTVTWNLFPVYPMTNNTPATFVSDGTNWFSF